MKDKGDLTRQIEEEGRDWIATFIFTAMILSLLLATTFCDAKASRAADPMPILQLDTLFIPQVAK